MAQTNSIKKVAITGATGHIGSHFVEALLKTGKHEITALTRADSKAKLPDGVNPVQVNYDDEQSLVSALRGQEFLIITLSVQSPPDLHTKIVQAAVKAGVPYIMPNAYGFDYANETLQKEDVFSQTCLGYCKDVESRGASYVAMVCGFWYGWSLALGEQWFGFDIKNRKVTFFDDGKTPINSSTLDQCGRGLAAFLSLPESGASPSVSQWKNGLLCFDSFKVSQRDMLDSLHRVVGTSDKDWEITYEPTNKRVKDGMEEMQKGDRKGFAKSMYSRIFYPNGPGLFEKTREMSNKTLGLPKEDLDEATKSAVDMVESGWSPF
ncbi:hypothetical protein ACLMJK_003552 [Lecanora helva]